MSQSGNVPTQRQTNTHSWYSCNEFQRTLRQEHTHRIWRWHSNALTHIYCLVVFTQVLLKKKLVSMGELEKSTWVSDTSPSQRMRQPYKDIPFIFFQFSLLYLFAYSRRVLWPQSGGLFHWIGILWWSVREGATFRERGGERERAPWGKMGGGHLN